MKSYASILAGTTDDRNRILIVSCETSASRQKEVAKTLVAAVAAGDCKSGKFRQHAEKITGKDIRENLQNVYELMKVFEAVLAGKIQITEEEFDNLDSSKLALLSPFLSKPELAEKLDEAVEAVKTGTAKDIRALKPSHEAKEPKAVKEMREAKEKAEKDLEDYKARERVMIDVQFAIVDLENPQKAVLESKMLGRRIKSDSEESPAWHAEYMLRFAAMILKNSPEIASTLAANPDVAAAVTTIFDTMTVEASAPEIAAIAA